MENKIRVGSTKCRINSNSSKQLIVLLLNPPLLEAEVFYIPELTRYENNATNPITMAILNKAIVFLFH